MTNYSDLDIIYRGKVIATLNPVMLHKQSKWHRIKELKKLHLLKHYWIRVLKKCKKSDIESCLYMIKQTEFALQREWGFKEDENYHRFWEYPRCRCPKLDNEERWGTGSHIINEKCILHGLIK